MKLGLFADPHYSTAECTCGNRYNSQSLRKIREAYRFFEEQRCDLVVCLGDVIDEEDTHEQERTDLALVAAELRRFSIPSVVVMGNHDAFAMTPEEFYGILGREYAPRTLRIEGKNFLFLDACWFGNGQHYCPGDSDWTDTYYPFPEALREELEGLEGETYLFLHQNLDPYVPANHVVSNAETLRDILEKSGRVKTVYQGHYHRGKRTERCRGIRYITVPAMCERECAFLVEEI